jgi:hypothetical protein
MGPCDHTAQTLGEFSADVFVRVRGLCVRVVCYIGAGTTLANRLTADQK